MSQYAPLNLSNLREGIVDTFSVEELKNMSSDLGVDFESLGGEGKEAKARELISYMLRRDRLAQLIAYCVTLRPRFAWPAISVEDAPSTREAQHPRGANDTRVTILFLASEPTDLARLRLGQEAREIQDKLLMARFRERFDLQLRMSVRPADVSQALLDVQPQVVHFSGHGTGAGELCLEDSTGRVRSIEPDALVALFQVFADNVKCVILNACYSELQARAIVQHVDYVVGMNDQIGDMAAIAFSAGFYQALGGGRTIEDAFKLGCVQIRLQGIAEHLIPVLLKRNRNAVSGTVRHDYR